MVGCGCTATGPSNQQQAPRPHRAPSLLSKLLAKDVRKEHSQLLQALRFLSRNNFLLDVGTSTSGDLIYPDVTRAHPVALEAILPPPIEDVDLNSGSEPE